MGQDYFARFSQLYENFSPILPLHFDKSYLPSKHDEMQKIFAKDNTLILWSALCLEDKARLIFAHMSSPDFSNAGAIEISKYYRVSKNGKKSTSQD